MGRIELEAPTNSTLNSLGLRPSAFIDIGSVWMLEKPVLTDVVAFCSDAAGLVTRQVLPGDANPNCGATETRNNGFKEFYRGDSPKPRLSIGIGVNWTSPFGPLRLDLAKALLTQKGDDTKLFSFNVGTAF
jgi:outer membrane protein insertion porin family